MTVTPTANQPSKTLTPIILILAGVITQILSYQSLWRHTSDTAEFLGRYSNRYAVILIAYGIITLGWIALLLLRKPILSWLERVPAMWRYGAIIISGIAILGLWPSGIELDAIEYLGVNWFILVVIVLMTLTDQPVQLRRWTWVLVGVLVLFTVPMFIMTLTERSFNPDEAMWADQASNFFVGDGLYARTWMRTPFRLEPGKGWSVVAYGWLLTHVAFDVEVGRIWNFAANLLGFAGIGLITGRLYSGKAALVSMAFALFSRMFLPVIDYRPDHQLPAVFTFTVFFAIQARYSQRQWVKNTFHFACGLLTTLSMQFHGAAITLIFGMALFYGLDFLWQLWRERRWAVQPLIFFGIGFLIGAGIYYQFNIQLAGGLDRYLGFLLETRWGTVRLLRYLTWPFLMEKIIVWSGLAYIVWRRNQADRLFLAMLVCILVGITLLDSLGYFSTYSALYIVPVGVLIVDGLRTATIEPGQNRRSIIAVFCLISLMIGQITVFIPWNKVSTWLQTGRLPTFIYKEMGTVLTPYIQDDDVIVSTHLLIWAFPTNLNLYAAGGEYMATRRRGLDNPVELWEQIKPTVVIDLKNQMDINEGLRGYMRAHDFQICQRFEVQGIAVDLYRPDCEGSTNAVDD